MAEHLDLYRTARRTAEALTVDGFPDGLHLVQVELAGQHDHVGELAVETQAFQVGDAQLRGDVHFQSAGAGGGDGRHVGADHGADTGFGSGIEHFPHGRQVLVVERDVEGQVAAQAVFPADRADLAKVFQCKVVGGM